MPLRYSCTNAAVAQAGTTFAHGLTNAITGVAQAPNEWWFNHRTAPVATAPETVCLYITAAPGTTSMILASASGATTADVFACINHTIIQ